MNLLDHISKLVARSKTLSRIEWLPCSGGVCPRIIKELNAALAAAETEKKRWHLLLSLLPLWTTERNTEAAQEIFGKVTLWKYNEPLVTSGVDHEPGREGYKIPVHCGQFGVFEIAGEKELLERYDRELVSTGHVITLDDLNRRAGF